MNRFGTDIYENFDIIVHYLKKYAALLPYLGKYYLTITGIVFRSLVNNTPEKNKEYKGGKYGFKFLVQM